MCSVRCSKGNEVTVEARHGLAAGSFAALYSAQTLYPERVHLKGS